MSDKDQIKLVNAGWIIIRPTDTKTQSAIMARTPDNKEWHMYREGFPGKGHRDQEVKNLLCIPILVQD
jgi:hypothetical protein